MSADTDLVSIAGSYTPLTKAGLEWRGACPVHGGDGPNFYVNPQKQIWACFSHGCHEEYGADAIGLLRSMGMSMSEAREMLGIKRDWKPSLSMPVRPPQQDRITSKPPADAPRPNMAWKFAGHEPNAPSTEPESVREFRDLQDDLLGFEARYPRGCDPDDPEKSPSRMWTWGARGTDAPTWGCGAFHRGEYGRPLYGLHRLTEQPDAPVCITEGPKKADAAQAILPGYACVSITGGCNGWRMHDWRPLAGRKILLWPDADQAVAKTETEAARCGCKVGDVLPIEFQPGMAAMRAIGDVLSMLGCE